MSRRSSAGDLVPKDISEILAKEARAQRGHRKPGGSLGQAICWLKGSRKKKNVGDGLNRARAAAATDVRAGYQNHAPGKASPKRNEDQKGLSVHYRASQHYPENVFIEGSRPQYLEDLHTEAQEGLKILQQEEHYSDGNIPDDESTSSTNTLQAEQEADSADSGCSQVPGITAGNSITTLTSADLAASNRSGLTRQGSTFKPLNTVKRPDQSQRRNRRTTILGIPNQVQRELALQRSSTFQPIASAQLSNGEEEVNEGLSGAVVIPTINGGTPVANQEGARVNLSNLEWSSEDQMLRKHLQAVGQEEQPVTHQDWRYHPTLNVSQRPKSVAVPGMTTSSTAFSFLQEPQGPVMSISPQATYLSKIIPNAVLPASVEVIKISRSRSRGSVSNHGSGIGAASRSSLKSVDSSVSPVLSRRSDGDGSNADDFPRSTAALGLTWSPPSETASNSSNVFSERSAGVDRPQTVDGLNVQGSKPPQPSDGQDHVSLCSSVSWVSGPSTNTGSPVKSQGSDVDVSGSASGEEGIKNSRPFTRSLSVLKTKLPPAPPRRTNSLHNSKNRKNSRDLLVVKDLSGPVSGEVNASTENVPSLAEVQFVTEESTKDEPETISVADPSSVVDSRSSASSSSFSPFQGSNGGAEEPRDPSVSSSSPQKTSSDGSNSERTMSPSSGYSSRSSTPTLCPKGISPTSPDKQKRKPMKPERSGSRASSTAASASSSLTSLSSSTSDLMNQEVSANTPSPAQQEPQPSVAASEKATHVSFPSPFAGVAARELLAIPPPPKVKAPSPPPPETWVHNIHTVELLCGPHHHLSRLSPRPVLGQPLKEGSSHRKETQIVATKVAQNENVTEAFASNENIFQEKPRTLSEAEAVAESVTQEPDSRECTSTHQGSLSIPEVVDITTDVQWKELNSNPLIKGPERQKIIPKREPPPVMKKTTPGKTRSELLLMEERRQKTEHSSGMEVFVPGQNSSSQPEIEVLVSKSEDVTVGMEVTSTQTLHVDVPKLHVQVDTVSPPPSPPPAYHPTPPPSRKTPPSLMSTPPFTGLEGVQEEAHAVETSWPPPPPPLEGETVFEGGDEVDFPPPPPFITEILPDVIDRCVADTEVPDQPGASLEEVRSTIKDPSESRDGKNDDIEIEGPAGVAEDTRPSEKGTQCPTINSNDSHTLLKDTLPPPEDVLPLPLEAPPPPPPLEAPPPPTITSSEVPLSMPTIVPLSSVTDTHSTKTKDPAPPEPPVSAPLSPPAPPPPPADNKASGVNFRWQPSLANARSKETMSRHKSAQTPKEDANIPLVTPSLLQMVRLRSVSMVEDETAAPTEEHDNKSTNGGCLALENCPAPTSGSQSIPQKPVRKSLSYKSPAHTVKTSSVTLNTPSMRLQEAIRMKTAAMSSRDGLPSRLSPRSSVSSSFHETGTLFPKAPEGCDLLKTPASTASFIFAKSTKRVIIETAVVSTPEAQASLKQSLAAELIQITDQSKESSLSNGGVKCDKVPPPVAKKPALVGTNFPICLAKVESSTGANGAIAIVLPAGYGTSSSETTTTVTPDTIETLF